MCCSICVRKDYIFYILIRCIHMYNIYMYTISIYSCIRICLVDEFSIRKDVLSICFHAPFILYICI